MKMNFALQGFEDGRDAARIVDLANKIVEKFNKDQSQNSFLTVTYVDDRRYQVAIDPHKDLVCVRREA